MSNEHKSLEELRRESAEWHDPTLRPWTYYSTERGDYVEEHNRRIEIRRRESLDGSQRDY